MSQEESQGGYSVKPFYDKLNLVFNAILALPLLAFVWLYLESNAGRLLPILDNSAAETLNFIIPIIVFGVIFASFYLFRIRISKIDRSIDLEPKLNAYFVVCVVMYAMLESALVISLIGYYLTLANVFIGMFVIVLVFFSLHKPTPYRIVKNLQLEGEERDQMMQKR